MINLTQSVLFILQWLVGYINAVKIRHGNVRVVDESHSLEHARKLSSGLVLLHVRLRPEIALGFVPVAAPGL